jgi:rhodanese-related sulfurtransferase
LSADKKNQEITELQNYSFNLDCSTQAMKTPNEINEINPADLLKMVDENPNLPIIDVREHWERELECIQPSLHIPLGNFHQENPPPSLPFTLDEEVVIYCKAGVRSLDACKVLSELGYTKLNNLSGGMMRWRAENMPLFLQDKQ